MNGAYGLSPPRAARPIFADPPAGTASNLLAVNNAGTPNTKIDISAAAIVLEDSRYNSFIARNVAVTADSAIVGAGGVESGLSISGAMWVARHIIACPANGVIKALLSASATAPVLPAGYTFSAFTGWHRTSSGNFMGIRQRGKRAQYVLSFGATGNTYPSMAALSGGFWAAVSVSNFVPNTASEIMGQMSYLAPPATTISVGVNPNSAPASSPLNAFYKSEINASTSFNSGLAFNMLLESSNIYYGQSNLTSGNLYCLGWGEQ